MKHYIFSTSNLYLQLADIIVIFFILGLVLLIISSDSFNGCVSNIEKIFVLILFISILIGEIFLIVNLILNYI